MRPLIDASRRVQDFFEFAPIFVPDTQSVYAPDASGEIAMRAKLFALPATLRRIAQSAANVRRSVAASFVLGFIAMLRLTRKRIASRAHAQLAALLAGAVAAIGLARRNAAARASAAIAVDPTALIQSTVERVCEHLRLRDPAGLRLLHIDLEVGELARVTIVPADLSAMLERLLVRVCEEMPAGGVVLVNASAEGGHDVIAIEPHRLLPVGARAFDRSIGNAVFDASELVRGLALTAPLERLGAMLRVESRVDAASALVIAIPAAQSAQDAAADPELGAVADTAAAGARQDRADPSSGDDPASADARRRVLIIDDDAGVLASLSEGLEHKGYHVASASNGYDGLRHLRESGRFDFVICDVAMPGMSGWELAERAAVVAPGTRILLVTGWASEIGRRDPRRKLVVDVLPKPVGLDVITTLIARAAK